MSTRSRLVTPVTICGAAVAGLGLAVELIHTSSHAAPVEFAVELLSLSYEQNLPTWYASSLLLACAVLLAAIGRDAALCGRRFHRYWLVLAAGFAAMSLDETAELHEQLHGLAGASEFVYFDWVIPAGCAVVAIGLAFVPFLRALPPRRRRDVVLAGALYLGGALVMELPLGWWTAIHGTDNAGYALIDWVEESLELAGASWFLIVLAGRWDDRAEAVP